MSSNSSTSPATPPGAESLETLHTSPTLIYEPLDIAKLETRILTIQPGPPGSTIECTLERMRLAGNGRYNALSYCWNEASNKVSIEVNSIQISVSSNLADALRQLRLRGVTRVWVDALCINQEDRREKVQQIGMMHAVYSMAETVFAWLGAEGSDRATMGLARLNKSIKARRASSSSKAENILKRVSPRTKAIIKSTIRVWVMRWRFRQVRDFLERPYWKRVWIIQEIAVASEVTILCGEEEISWKNLERALRNSRMFKVTSPQIGKVTKFVHRIQKMHHEYQGRFKPSLQRTIRRFQSSQASEDRDRIFSLLNICHDGQSLVPLPDYDQPLDEFQIELTRRLIRQKRSLNIILLRCDDRTRGPGLPSWTPDWVSGKLDFTEYEDLNSYKFVWKRYKLTPRPGFEKVLDVDGILVGTVETVSSITKRSHIEDTRPIISDQSWSDYYVNEQEALEALYSCLVMRRGLTRAKLDPVRFFGWAPGFLNPQDIDLLWYALHIVVPESHELWLQPRRWLPMLYIWFYFKSQRDDDISLHKEKREQEEGQRQRFNFERWVAVNSVLAFHGQTLLKILERSRTSHSPDWISWLLLLQRVIEIFNGLNVLISGLAIIPCLWYRAWRLVFAEVVLFLLGRCLRGLDEKLEKIHARVDFIGEALFATFRKPVRFIVSREGFVGMVQPETRPGDKICFLDGCNCPVVLRQVDSTSGPQYEVVGTAFIFLSSSDQERYKGFVSRYDSVQRRRTGGETEDDYGERDEESMYEFSSDEEDEWWEEFETNDKIKQKFELV